MVSSPWLNFPASILANQGSDRPGWGMPYRLDSETGLLPEFLHPPRDLARQSVSEVQLL